MTLLVAWICVTILAHYAQQPRLLRPALLLGALLMVQLSLGVGSYLMKMAARGAVQPLPPVVDVTTMHVAVGALVLVASLFLTYQTHRFLTPREAEKLASTPHQATT